MDTDAYYRYKAKKYESKYNQMLAKIQQVKAANAAPASPAPVEKLSAEDAYYKAKYEKYQRKYDRLMAERAGAN